MNRIERCTVSHVCGELKKPKQAQKQNQGYMFGIIKFKQKHAMTKIINISPKHSSR